MYNSQLKTFVCVADCGSFSRAAERLYISSTSVMKQINSLEAHLELKLMERTNQGIRLTESGKVIYKHAKYLINYSGQAVAEARQAAAEAEAAFCVGTSILNPCKPFMDIWYQVNDQFPGYRLHIIPFEDDHNGILSEISALGEKFDFLIGGSDSQLWLNRCNFLQIGTYRQCIAVPREHPLAKKQRLAITDLYGETVMLVKRGDSATVDGIRDELEQHPQIKTEDTAYFYDMEVFNRCVQNRCLLVTLECWADVHPSLVTLPVEWDHALPYGILYQLQPSEEILRFLDAVKDRVLS